MAYECLTGRRPFDGDTPVSVALAQVRDEPPALPDTVPGAGPRAGDADAGQGARARARPAPARLGEEALALVPTLTEAGPPAAAVAPTRAMPQVDAAAAASAAGDDSRRSHGESTTAVVIDPPARHHTDTDPGFHLPLPTAATRVAAVRSAALVIFLLLLAAVRACDGGDDTGRHGRHDGQLGGVALSHGTGARWTSPRRTTWPARSPTCAPSSRISGCVSRSAHSDGGGPVGTVKEVSPTGELEVGSQVTLDVVAEAARHQRPKKPGKEKKPGPAPRTKRRVPE